MTKNTARCHAIAAALAGLMTCATSAEPVIPPARLLEKVEQAWAVSWERFYLPETELFYDYLSSYEAGRGLAHLPKAEEVAREYPNPYGYGTGMEDCMISAGVMLSMIIDRYEVTRDDKLKGSAKKVFGGIRRCAEVHGVPGFIARGVCPEDRRGVYSTSSRDQYTHCVHGLWQYAHSGLCDDETKAAITRILAAIADRMTRNVTPENDYDFLTVNGARDPRGICRMFNVDAHEAARLPMFYAAAWDIGRGEEYHKRYRELLPPTIEHSFQLKPRTMTYALLQMQCSLELLREVEADGALKERIGQAMELVAAEAARRAIKASKEGAQLDLTMVGEDWRTGPALKGPYRKVWYGIRESGEAALTQLMVMGRVPFSKEQAEVLAGAIDRVDYARVSTGGIFYLQAAYWKARRLGVFEKP